MSFRRLKEKATVKADVSVIIGVLAVGVFGFALLHRIAEAHNDKILKTVVITIKPYNKPATKLLLDMRAERPHYELSEQLSVALEPLLPITSPIDRDTGEIVCQFKAVRKTNLTLRGHYQNLLDPWKLVKPQLGVKVFEHSAQYHVRFEPDLEARYRLSIKINNGGETERRTVGYSHFRVLVINEIISKCQSATMGVYNVDKKYWKIKSKPIRM